MTTGVVTTDYTTMLSHGTVSAKQSENHDFADTMEKAVRKPMTVTSSEGLTLRYQKDYVAEDGSTCLTSWVDARTGVNTCVFKPANFDEENPVYRVEVWDKAGNMTERYVAPEEIDPKHASSAEMYAYSVHLEETGQCKDALLSMMGANHRLVDRGFNPDGLTSYNWIELIKDLVREQYTIGNTEGYLRYKTFYDAMAC